MELGTINGRMIHYLETTDPGWSGQLPEADWIALVVADQVQQPRLDAVVKAILDRQAILVCSAGKAAEEVDEAFDWEIIHRQMNAADVRWQGPETTFQDDWQEGLSFAITQVMPDTAPAVPVVCINLTGQDYKDRLTAFLQQPG